MQRNLFFLSLAFLALHSPAVAFAENQELAGWRNVDPARVEPSPVKVLWQADLSRWPDGFTVEKHDGAEGFVTRVESAWGPALKIVKSNDIGFITVSAKPVTFSAGTKLQQYVYTSGEKNDPEGTVALVRFRGKEGNLNDHRELDGRGPGGPRMWTLVNTTPGERIRKLCRIEANEKNGTTLTPTLAVAGCASESIWSGWGIEDLPAALEKWTAFVDSVESADHSGDRMGESDFDRLLAADTDHTAKVVKRDGRGVLLLDGQESVPVFYKGFLYFGVNTNKIVYCGKKMADAGIKVQVVPVRFGNDPLRHGWWTKDGFDAKGAVRAIKDMMRMAPNGYFILSCSSSVYPEFVAEHPESVWRNMRGEIVEGNHLFAIEPSVYPERLKGPHWPWPSISSTTLRREVLAQMQKLVDELKATGLSKRIVGIHVCGFNDGQLSPSVPDFSEPARLGFVRWQEKTFGKVLWQTAPKYDRSVKFFQAGRDDHQIAYHRYLKYAPTAFIEDIARGFKGMIGKDVIVTRWWMSPYKGQFNDALDGAAFANSEVIDIITPQPAYDRRTPGLALSTRVPMASFREHGKLMICEFDLRTYAAIHPGEVELRNMGLSFAGDFGTWQTLYRKVAAGQIAARHGWWFFDMGGGWYDTPELSADIGKTLANERELLANPNRRPEPVDTALVIDEDGFYCRNTLFRDYDSSDESMGKAPLHLLSQAGVPMDNWLLGDLMNRPELAERYQTFVILGMMAIDGPRRAWLERLGAKGRTIVFLNRTGVSGGIEATGFSTRIENGKDHRIAAAAGVKERFYSRIENQILYRYLDGGKPTGYWNPERMSIIESSGVKALARYRDDGSVAVAERAFPGWKSVLVAECGALSPDYFNRLVREGGGYAPVDRQGLVVEMNADFLSVHCVIPGHYDFRLPAPQKVVNMKTGEALGESLATIPLDLTAGETRWYRLGGK